MTLTGDAQGDDQLAAGTNLTDLDATDPIRLEDNTRVLNYFSSFGDLTINDLAITGGRPNPPFENGSNGGGVRFGSNGQLLLNRSTVSGNATVGRGGGVHTNEGSVTIINSTLSGNSSGSHGGGIFVLRRDLEIINSTINENASVERGGGITSFFSGDVAITNSNISGNTSGVSGGGISAGSGVVSITNSTVSGNTSGRGGGASAGNRLVLYNTTVVGNASTSGGGLSVTNEATIKNSAIIGNTSSGDGGGISTHFGILNLVNSTVSGNAAGNRGGGIFTTAISVGNLSNSTVIENSAGDMGGGIFVRFLNSFDGNQPLTIENSIVADNTGRGEVPNDLVPNPDSVLTINHSLIGVADNLVQPITGDIGNQTGTTASPLNPLLGPLADNGGPTLTHAPLPGSPVINRGDPDFVTTTGTDQRGNPFVRVAGGIVDIGAVESQGTPTRAVGDYNGDNVVDAADYTAWRDAFDPTTPVTPLSGADGDGDGFVTLNDRDVWRSHFGFVYAPPAEPTATAVVTVAPPLRQPAFVEPEPETDAAFAVLAVVPPPTGVGGSPSLAAQSGSVDLTDDDALLLLALAPASGPSDDLAAEITTLDNAFAEEAEQDETSESEFASLT